MCDVDTKSYIQEQYKLAYQDYFLAPSGQARNDALDALARLDRLATELYGYDYAQSLKASVQGK